MNQKSKNLYSFLAVLIIGYLVLAHFLNLWPANAIRSSELEDRSSGSEVCIQVITFAVNPKNGDIMQFPNPCDVPDGWEIVEADIISGEE